MRVACIGCVESSHRLLESVLELPEAEVVAVVTRTSSGFHADHRSLAPLAERAGAGWLDAAGNDQDRIARFLAAARPDLVYSFGWPYLLGRRVLEIPPLGCVGWHPAALPEHRGRHPIVWALALGLEETRSTFFVLEEGADSGDVLSEEPVAIGPGDDAGTLYRRLVETARRQLAELTPALAAGTAVRKPQDPARAGWWRKRGRADGRIDWRMSAPVIHDLVRALAPPYPGAHWEQDGAEVKVWRTAPVTAGVPRDAEPGKVLAVDGGVPLVKCGEGAIRLLEREPAAPLSPGSYLT